MQVCILPHCSTVRGIVIDEGYARAYDSLIELNHRRGYLDGMLMTMR